MKRGEIIRLFHIGASVHDVVVEAAEGEEVAEEEGEAEVRRKHQQPRNLMQSWTRTIPK